MNTSELMIGDIVCVDGDDNYDSPIEIEAILQGNEVIADMDILDAEWIIPVPLTREILELNGFERSHSISDTEPHNLDEDGCIYYQIGEPHLWLCYKDGIARIPCLPVTCLELKYVHELQNLMRSVGLDAKFKTC